MEKVIKAPVFNLVSVIAEAQTFKTWIPLLYKSEIPCEFSNFRKVGEFAVRMPYPFSNRAANLAVSGMPVIGKKAFVLNMRSLDVGKEWLKGYKVTPENKCTEATVHFASCIVETIGDDVQRLRVIANLDPNLKKVPAWLINYAIKVVGLVFLNQIAKKAEKLSKTYLDLIEKN